MALLFKSLIFNMRTIFATALLTTVSIAEPMEFEYMKYVSEWNKSYATREEFETRMARWLEADKFIKMVNAPDSEYTHTAGHNNFSDWTEAEYKKMLNLPKHNEAADTVGDTVYGDVVPNGSTNW